MCYAGYISSVTASTLRFLQSYRERYVIRNKGYSQNMKICVFIQ